MIVSLYVDRGTAAAPCVPVILGPRCSNVFCGRTTPTMYWVHGGPFCALCVKAFAEVTP